MGLDMLEKVVVEPSRVVASQIEHISKAAEGTKDHDPILETFVEGTEGVGYEEGTEHIEANTQEFKPPKGPKELTFYHRED